MLILEVETHSLTGHSGIVGIINAILAPYMLNPTAWDWSNFTGFFWVSTTLV